MSSEITTETPKSDRFQVALRDPFLEELICIADECNKDTGETSGIGITISVNGMLVSGYIISYREHLEHYCNSVLPSNIKQMRMDDYEKHYNENEYRRNFIHLKNVRFYTPGQVPIPGDDISNVFWRGRLAEIAGFNLGVLETKKK